MDIQQCGLVYVGGGTETEWNISYRIDCYEPVSGSWSPPISTPYCHFAMTILKNNLLIAGGWDKNSKTTNQILTLDIGQTQLRDYTKMNSTCYSCWPSGNAHNNRGQG